MNRTLNRKAMDMTKEEKKNSDKYLNSIAIPLKKNPRLAMIKRIYRAKEGKC